MVALAGEVKGWLVEVATADEAIDIVDGTVPRAREAGREELLVWTERYYRDRYLLGAEMPASWTRLCRRGSATGAPGPAGAVSSTAAFAGGAGSSPGRTSRRTPIRSAAGRCAQEASAPPRLSVVPVRTGRRRRGPETDPER